MYSNSMAYIYVHVCPGTIDKSQNIPVFWYCKKGPFAVDKNLLKVPP
jgi:hypothetical protein